MGSKIRIEKILREGNENKIIINNKITIELVNEDLMNMKADLKVCPINWLMKMDGGLSL